MIYIATIHGVPLFRAASSGLMGRKIAKAKKRLSGKTLKQVFHGYDWVQSFSSDPAVRVVNVFGLDGDRVTDVLTYEV